MALLGISCSQSKPESESQISKTDTNAKTPVKSVTVRKTKAISPNAANNQYPAWVDTLVTSYVKNTTNNLVRYAITHQLQESWILDDRKETDSATYWVFNVGHDVSEAGSKDPRYISDNWIYVDSLKRKLYEYDPANEKLLGWKGR